MLVTVDCCSNWWWGVDYKEMKSMEDEIQCHGQLDGGIWLLLYWGWCKCRYKKQTVASLLQLVLALLGRCAMWVCGKLECLLLLRSASSSDESRECQVSCCQALFVPVNELSY